MRALIEIGEPEEALATYSVLGGDAAKTHEYIDALIKTRKFQAAAESAIQLYRTTQDPTIQRKYLDTLSRYDMQASLDAYASHVKENPDAEILFDYILLLKANGDYATALAAAKTLLEHAADPDIPACRMRSSRKPWS